ncbi:DUF262 domain-containing protein [Actinomycetospora sp. OC33-EN08]|uniref:DUF262 domain-containing protein n=1 Tax=Actinomycetospora aurantiaca TaxID=3129233 RepID=A0ABU8MHN8_9PSEU
MSMLDVEAAEAQIVAQSKRIEFYITELSIEILAQKMRDGEYEVPPYQREFTWEAIRKSRFLESLLMGLPIPFIFFWEMPDGRLEIVDGSQRLRTLEEFLLGDFRLGELEQLSAVSGFGFKDLPASRQRKFRNRSIRGIVLNEHADEAARFDMFERINTGSKIANPAELRRGALGGPFMQLVITLARDERFVELTPMSAKSEKERAREELVARFFAYGDGLDGYHDRPSEFVFEYAKIMNKKFAADPELADSYAERFFRMVSFVDRNFPYGFKKNARSQATAKARFEAIAVGSYLAMSAKPELATVDSAELAVPSWINSNAFVERTSSDGANAVARLRGRFDYVRDRLLGQAE